MTSAVVHAAQRLLTSFRWLLFLPFFLLIIQQAMYEWNARSFPLETIFKPLSIQIPDHCAGTDPEILYTRILRGTFTGRYHSALERQDQIDAPVVSFDSAWLQYTPRPSIEYRRKLSEFMGFRLAVDPGIYQVFITWTVRRPGFRDEAVSLSSNDFTIRICD